MKEIEAFSILFVYSLPAKRLKKVKTALYKMLGEVRYKCECGCDEMRITNQEGLDIIKRNIKMISQRQMEMKV